MYIYIYKDAFYNPYLTPLCFSKLVAAAGRYTERPDILGAYTFGFFEYKTTLSTLTQCHAL